MERRSFISKSLAASLVHGSFQASYHNGTHEEMPVRVLEHGWPKKAKACRF